MQSFSACARPSARTSCSRTLLCCFATSGPIAKVARLQAYGTGCASQQPPAPLASVRAASLLSFSSNHPARRSGAPPVRRSHVAAGGDGSTGDSPLTLVLYSKQGCHLCEGLQEKLEAVLQKAQFMPGPLTNCVLEVRDIESNAEWLQLYEMEVPVLKARLEGATAEALLPRPMPRITAEKLQKHVEQAIAGLTS